MSYTIQYSPENNERYPLRLVRKKWNLLVFTCLLLFAFGIGWFGTQKRETIKEFLIPGDPEFTEDAFSIMVSDIRNGTDIGDAITAFCLEIIENADNRT